jgi:hypothetical protein
LSDWSDCCFLLLTTGALDTAAQKFKSMGDHWRFSVAVVGATGVGKSALVAMQGGAAGVSPQSLSRARVTVGIGLRARDSDLFFFFFIKKTR